MKCLICNARSKQVGREIENIFIVGKAVILAFAFHPSNIFNHFIIKNIIGILNKVSPSVNRDMPLNLHLGEMNAIF